MHSRFLFYLTLTLSLFSCRDQSKQSHFIDVSGKYYEGLISSTEFGENYLSFDEQENLIFFTRGSDWEKQTGFIAKKENGLFSSPQQVDFVDTLYNGAISPSGNKIIFCKRLPERTEIFLTEKEKNQWSIPKNLSESSGIYGGYFNWFSESELFFYISENNGDLVEASLEGTQLKIKTKLSDLNTKEGTEFSPFVDKEKRFIIFTRYTEGDQAQQGFFVSYNSGTKEQPSWQDPSKIETLEYGWGAYISRDQKYFYYTDGDDIFAIPLANLNLKTGNPT